MLDEQSSATAAAMASGGIALQLLATQRCGEAGKTLQPATGCSSLLRQWPAALQLAVLGQQCCNSRRWPTTRYSPGQHCVAAFLFFFTRQLQE